MINITALYIFNAFSEGKPLSELILIFTYL